MNLCRSHPCNRRREPWSDYCAEHAAEMTTPHTDSAKSGDRIRYWFGNGGTSSGKVVGVDDDLLAVRDDYTGRITYVRTNQVI